MLTISLKLKHLIFIASYLEDIVAGSFRKITKQIEQILPTNVETLSDLTNAQLATMYSITIAQEDLCTLYLFLSQGEEGLMAAINREIEADLMPQLVTMATAQAAQRAADTPTAPEETSPNTDLTPPLNLYPALFVVDFITKRKEVIATWVTNRLEKGIKFLI